MKNKYNVLYVDDEPNNLSVFRASFFKHYNIFTAESGSEGIEIMTSTEIHLVITDQKMPKMTGLEFLEKTRDLHPEAMRMILTGYSDVGVIMDAVNRCGIYQYIMKPWGRKALKLIIDNALDRYKLSVDNRELLQNLEEKVEARTEELSRSNASLQSANEVKDKLFSIISHDLRSPLSTLSNFVSVLINFQDAFSQEEIKDLAVKIQTSLQNVNDLLNNLLYWSRNQMHTTSSEPEKLSVREVADKSVKLFAATAEQKEITLEALPMEEDLFVMADKNMLQTIYRNLISNAIKFTEPGGKITVSSEQLGDRIAVSVSDTGIGMSEEVAHTIFRSDKHYTTYGTAKEKGTGLGLKLCKEFIEIQKGSIRVESVEGKGSIFTFELPQAD